MLHPQLQSQKYLLWTNKLSFLLLLLCLCIVNIFWAFFFSFICSREFLTFEHRLFLPMLLICPLVIVSPYSQNNKFLFIALSVCCHYCGLFILPEGCFVSYFWKAIRHICSGFIGLHWFIIFWHIQCSRYKFNEKENSYPAMDIKSFWEVLSPYSLPLLYRKHKLCSRAQIDFCLPLQ